MTIFPALLAAALSTPAQQPVVQAPQPAPAAQTPVQVQGQQTTPRAEPVQGRQPTPFGRPSDAVMGTLQGFNIVLLIGESTSSGPSIEDVPPAARKALADMRDFLPFKHYRVLDSQWTSCCGNPSGSHISGRLQGVTMAQAGTDTKLIPRPYSFQLSASAGSRLNVQFNLTPDQLPDRASQSPITTARANELEKRLISQRRELETLDDDLTKRHQSGSAAEVSTIREQRRRVQQQIAETMNELTAARNHGAEVDRSNRSLINGSFTMEVGETVVVGTSRLGGDKALIAIVTAARKSGR